MESNIGQVRSQRWRHTLGALLVGVSGLSGSTLLGCHELTGSQPLPAGTPDPSSFNTPAGARGMRNQVIANLQLAITSYITSTGMLTDELESSLTGASPAVRSVTPLSRGPVLDARVLQEFSSQNSLEAKYADSYADLQHVRANIDQALGALAAYDTLRADTATVKILQGELFALRAYTEILLDDFFCSGVPLSTFDFQGDFTYRPSSTRDQVYQDALTQLDSALALADTSTQVLNLARVLRGRALLDLGQYAQAAQAVAAVPDGFQYQLALTWNSPGSPAAQNVINGDGRDGATVSDTEGINGLPFRSSGDPRTAVHDFGLSQGTTNTHLWFPLRYMNNGHLTTFAPFPVADWIEARLIQAEAALQGGDPTTWLALLNHLRETAMVPGQTATLNDTTDPGSDTARVSLMFRERAFWLFLSGHRQGDLRRLIRQYQRDPEAVYPTGVYLGPGASLYGSDVTAPIPSTETPNPLFHGCLDRAA